MAHGPNGWLDMRKLYDPFYEMNGVVRWGWKSLFWEIENAQRSELLHATIDYEKNKNCFPVIGI
jgi:hypothetical protein